MLRASFEPWRRLHASPSEIRYRVQRMRDLDAEGRTDEALVLGEATLEYAPFDSELLLWLVRAYATRGDAESHAKHIRTAFYVNVLDESSARADASLQGALTAKAFARALKGAGGRDAIGNDRSRDFYLTEVEPRQDRFCTTLRWPREHTETVRGALERFCADTARVQRVVFPKQHWYDDYGDWVERRVAEGARLELEGETMPSAFCHLGRVVVLLQELAPFVDDVRTLLHDQTSPLYEVWIVDHACYVRRHPIHADGEMWEHLDDMMQREGIRDAPLEQLLVEHFTREAAGWVSATSSRYFDPEECKRKAELLLGRAARLGEAAPYVRARMDLDAGEDDRAVEALERMVEESAPGAGNARAELIDIYIARDRFTDALRILECTAGVDRHRWAVAYEGAGLWEEAAAAYIAHAEQMKRSSSGVLLRQADELFDRGWIESARIYYSVLGKTKEFSTPIRAELGMALCAERRGAKDEAAAHYERVLARAPAQRRKYRDAPSIVAAIEHCEHVAVRWRDADASSSPSGGLGDLALRERPRPDA